MTADKAICSLRDFHAGYGDGPVLHGIDFDLYAGERVALIGPSGAGKSTLLRHLHQHLGDRAALVAQAYDLIPQLDVARNIDAARLDRRSCWRNLRNLFWLHADDRRAITALAGELGLGGLEGRRVGELSGGQQQRVAVARALHRAADILLADEPVSAVDPEQAEAVLQLMRSGSRTLVLVMHALAPARRFCDRLVGLREGRIVLDVRSEAVSEAELDRLFRP